MDYSVKKQHSLNFWSNIIMFVSLAQVDLRQHPIQLSVKAS